MASQDSNTVSVIDSSTNTIIDTITVGQYPRFLEFNPSNDNIYVTNSVGDSVSVISTVENNPPNCSAAQSSESILWPPNHNMTDINIIGITDPDGDIPTIQIKNIFQDEPTKLTPGDKSPDGSGIGTEIAKIRAERDGNGDGRVYHIEIEASDGQENGICNGEVIVSVPHNIGREAIDSGAIYDSTI